MGSDEASRWDREESSRRKVIKLLSGKGGSFPVEKEEASRWEGRKLPSG